MVSSHLHKKIDSMNDNDVVYIALKPNVWPFKDENMLHKNMKMDNP